MSNFRVLILADDHFARVGLTAILGEQEDVSVVASLASTEELHQAVSTYLPDVLLWDLGWEVSESIERLEAYLEGVPPEPLAEQIAVANLPPVLALVAEPEDSAAARETGATGILLRDASAERLVNALRAVSTNLFVTEPEFEAHLFAESTIPIEPLVEPLTPREHEILQLIAEGLANKAIARQLNISDHTVKFHTTAIFGKLGVSSRTEAVVRATRAGLILL